MKKEISQFIDYQIFIVLHSGENIPIGYQEIAYHIVFDVKYDCFHDSWLVAGTNWALNDKEDICSRVFRMDTVRTGSFLGELYGLSCHGCDIGNDFLNGKT
jgi:hypothetical protein